MALRQRTRIARRLRRDATEVEKRLWRALRETFPTKRFRRQHPIGCYIVDFACPAARLAIELDGGQHELQPAADLLRSQEISRYGYRILRFWNNEVAENPCGVLDAVERELIPHEGVALSALQGGEGGAHREAMGG